MPDSAVRSPLTDNATVSCSDESVRNGSQSVDGGIVRNGREKSDRVDLGLNLLSYHAGAGVCYDFAEIAAWAGCSDAAIVQIYRRGLRKLRRGLERQGIGPAEIDEVVRLLRRADVFDLGSKRPRMK